VVKFDGTNFPFWKFQIFLAFEQHDLLKIVTGDDTKPTLVTAVDAQGVAHSNEGEIRSWCNRDNAARVSIVATIEQVWQRSLRVRRDMRRARVRRDLRSRRVMT
jgi:hypothetical protein